MSKFDAPGVLGFPKPGELWVFHDEKVPVLIVSVSRVSSDDSVRHIAYLSSGHLKGWMASYHLLVAICKPLVRL